MRKQTLLIRLFEGGAAEWGLFGAGGELLRGPGQGLPAREDAGEARVVVLAPGERVLLTEAVVPTRNPVRLRRALPYAVEDRLAADVDRVHVAGGVPDPEGRVPAAVVDRDLMAQWLTRLREVGLEPDALVPEPLALPAQPGSRTYLLEDGRVVARLGEDQGWAGEASLLAVCASATDDEATVYLAGEEAGEPPEALRDRARILRIDESALALMARGLTDDRLDLLQGDYTPRRAHEGAARLWRVAAALLLVWVALELIFTGADVWRLQRESERLESRIEAVFSDTFPGARVVDPRAQMAQRLSELAADGADALALLRQAAPALTGNGAVTLNSLEYRDGELILSVQAGSLADLDRLRSNLAARPGLHVEMGSATTGQDGAAGRLMVRGGAA